MTDADVPMFEALIVPHRSLSPRALRLLLAVVVTMCCATSGVFVWLGAWPVGGYTGLELLLAGWLLRLHARSALATELLLLSPNGLRVERTDPDGARRSQMLSPAWLAVRMEERPGRVPALLLVGRATKLEVGASLGEIEKRSLAKALSDALHRWRNPVFDNPQLRIS